MQSSLDEPCRIAAITPELHRAGGTERSFVEILLRLVARKPVRVFTMEADPSLVTSLQPSLVPAMRGPHLIRFVWWYEVNRVIRNRDARCHGQPHVVLSPGVNSADSDVVGVHMLFGRHHDRAASSGNGASAATLWRRIHRRAYYALLRWLERRTYTGPATLWAHSAADARWIEHAFSRPNGSVSVIRHGVDTAWFTPSDRDRRRADARRALDIGEEKVLLVVGNEPWTKGMDLAIGALSALPEDVHIALAGKITASSSTDELATSARVRTWPHRDDPRDYYAAADVLVAPSREDTFNLPVLEALASGLPVVVSRRAGVSELLDDRLHALLLEDPLDANAVAKAVLTLLQDANLEGHLTRNGRALAEQCTWEESAFAVETLIDREARSPRVLVLAPEARGMGGIQRATRSLTAALSHAFGEDRIGVVSLRMGDQAVKGRVLHEGTAVAPKRRLRASHKAVFLLASMRAARRWRRRLVVVAAHAHLSPVARACNILTGAPYVVWCHGIESWGRPRRAVVRGLREANIVFAPSHFTARRVEAVVGLASGSVRVIPHCVSLMEGFPHKSDGWQVQTPRPTVLTVARLTSENRHKGIDTLLYAWPGVLSKLDADLLVVGDGPDRGRLESIADLLQLGDYVRFVGRLTDEQLADAFAQAQLFALPARHRLEPIPEGEGFGLVYVEAGASGLPVIGGRGSGTEEAVEDGVSGLLVDSEDADEVARTIVRVLSDPVLASRLGEGGLDLATKRFSPDVFLDRVVQLILDLHPRGLVP